MGDICPSCQLPRVPCFNLLCRLIPTMCMTEAASMVFVVDDDPSVRRAIKRLVESVGLKVELFGSAAEFMSSSHPDIVSCLVLDIRLPGISGLDFQRKLASANV